MACTNLEIIETGAQHPEQNMRSDYERLLNLSSTAKLSLRFYEWLQPSATYGYFIDPSDFLDQTKVHLARRPTGGGIIFHGNDLAFSLIIPATHPAYSHNTLQNYAYVNERLAAAIRNFDPTLEPALLQNRGSQKPQFCMSEPTVYDLIIGGLKVAGGAQRKTRLGILHQGSICLAAVGTDFLEKILKPHTPYLHGYPLFQKYPAKDFLALKQLLKQKLIEAFRD